MTRTALIPALLILASCGMIPLESDAPPQITRSLTDNRPVPTPVMYSAKTARVSNQDIVTDFLDLNFRLESGQTLPVLTRFEGPISVRVTGQEPSHFTAELDALLGRLRREAGINIARTNSAQANITIGLVKRSEIRRALPNAACFVVPNVTRIAEFQAMRRSDRVRWSKLRERRKVGLFLPGDASPQELRDCLHEELAQALGPLNDLYRLPNSVFNDDNVHTVLTSFDMLLLRASYDPSLRSGMNRAQVAAALPEVLARINPAGEHVPNQRRGGTPVSYSRAIQTALGPGASRAQRKQAANQALQIAHTAGWQDHRLAFAHYAAGRIAQAGGASQQAHQHFTRADQIYARQAGTELHRAYVAAQLGAYALSRNRPTEALAAVEPFIPVAARHQNRSLQSTLTRLRARAQNAQNS